MTDERIKDFDAMKRAILNETDRGIAITSYSYLEVTLDKMLTTQFKAKDMTARGMFFDRLSCDARLRLCYLLGIISKKELNLLIKIKKLRNFMAHRLHYESFEHPKIAPMCNDIYKHFEETALSL